jgi:hypothetical protein
MEMTLTPIGEPQVFRSTPLDPDPRELRPGIVAEFDDPRDAR